MSEQNSAGLRQSLKIIQIVAHDSNGIAFSELRRRLDNLAAPTVSRLLKVLISEEWLRKSDEGRYRPGPRLIDTAFGAVGGRNRAALVQPIVERLAQETGQSAAYVELTEAGLLFRAKREMPESFHYINLGSVNAAVTNHGFGLVALAYAPDSLREKFIPAEDATPEAATLRQALEAVRQAGFGSYQDKGLRLAVPVRAETHGELLGVIGITLWPRELSPDENANLLDQVRNAAECAARALG